MLPIHEIVMIQINKEIDSIHKALNEENTGKARVCARRGAGLAVNFKLRDSKEISEDLSSITFLNLIIRSQEYPENVKNAAWRLAAKVNYPKGNVSEDPLEDCRLIVDYFMR